jgi:hypothetical protein
MLFILIAIIEILIILIILIMYPIFIIASRADNMNMEIHHSYEQDNVIDNNSV